ncbi:unnamed protein product, partial [Prorocentrum cordatum]
FADIHKATSLARGGMPMPGGSASADDLLAARSGEGAAAPLALGVLGRRRRARSPRRAAPR